MPTLEFTCVLNAPIHRVWAFHDTVETLFKLTPPSIVARLEGDAQPMGVGVVYRLRMRRWGMPLAWDAEIVEYAPPFRFVDRQLPGRGPFRSWRHEHLFASAGDGDRTLMTDRVTYELPFGLLGRLVDRLFVRRDLTNLFAYRHKITRESVE